MYLEWVAGQRRDGTKAIERRSMPETRATPTHFSRVTLGVVSFDANLLDHIGELDRSVAIMARIDMTPAHALDLALELAFCHPHSPQAQRFIVESVAWLRFWAGHGHAIRVWQ